ncbi:ABC transporter substrate-binding protein [Paenibacillus paeoniae]|uniref:ABC transporter substrate-binding protein n=1 Tax=Paenibacillus paeoniae TaxID=2292705 RepID=A0A371PIS6_9BACL|nr:ABC transporter substrate-binding protein [Paenibacillus paeoniae]REK76044.1 ABC transporter substrate-binding protein [Paenibacillus paeoniae]
MKQSWHESIYQNRRWSTILIFTLILTLLAACSGNSNSPTPAPSSSAQGGEPSPSAAPTPEPGSKLDGGDVVVIVPQDPDYLDPHLAVAAGTSEIMFNVFEGLLKPNEKGQLYPAIAESYEVAPDGLTYTFKLRSGVQFHNGESVKAADVKYSYERLAGIDTGKPLQASFASVTAVEAPDEATVVIKLKENNAAFLTALTAAVIPKDYADSNTKPIGTGPFKFVDYLPGQRLTLAKNPAYYVNGVPSLDKVEFRIIPDQEAAFLAFKSGEADIFPRIGTEKLEELGDEFQGVSGPQNLVQVLIYNIAKKPFDDVRVRQAVNHAINKDELIEGVALGNGIKLGSHLSPIMAQYFQEGLEDYYAYDVEKAKGLLAEAGYADGFSVKLSVPSNYAFHVATAEVAAQQLSKVGIKVTIEPVEWAVWLERIYKGHDYESTIIGFDGKLNPYDILNKYLSDSPNNLFKYNSPTFDETLRATVTEIDQEKRTALFKDLQTELAKEAAAVYIMDPYLNVALKKNLAGYKQYPLYVQDLSTVYWTN